LFLLAAEGGEVMDAEQCIQYAHEHPDREPMIRMTVRQRDLMLYRIKELEAELSAAKARIKIIETAKRIG